eukprot:GHRR01032575.1.p2 GENE.GHRR01032575.1~~GHRR01032575.1.p2  ORF type:complete len:116 (-),score=20.30 GHRR01032575.1:510-857(-)
MQPATVQVHSANHQAVRHECCDLCCLFPASACVVHVLLLLLVAPTMLCIAWILAGALLRLSAHFALGDSWQALCGHSRHQPVTARGVDNQARPKGSLLDNTASTSAACGVSNGKL